MTVEHGVVTALLPQDFSDVVNGRGGGLAGKRRRRTVDGVGVAVHPPVGVVLPRPHGGKPTGSVLFVA